MGKSITAQISILDVLIRKGEHALTRAGYAHGRSQAEYILEHLIATRDTLRQIEPLADDMRELVRKRLVRLHEAELAKRHTPQKTD